MTREQAKRLALAGLIASALMPAPWKCGTG